MTSPHLSGTPVTIRRALLSVSDKTGLIDLARALASRNVELLSTGGTAKALRDAGLPVRDVSEFTGFPEMMDGRVKTLHPLVHGGLLGRAGIDDTVMAEHGIGAIDLLVLNLYPFEAVSANPNSTLDEIIENIDIGGPAMLRSAAKNYARVAVATDPAQYACILEELNANLGSLSAKTRFALSVAAFNRVAQYDGFISNYLSSIQNDGSLALFPEQNNSSFIKVMDLRYGENPHQQGAFYRDLQPAPGTLATFTQLQGKELSYNNLADADAAWECVRLFGAPACAIVKHANPCGVAEGIGCADTYEAAYATDPTSAFGGIIAFNTRLDGATAKTILDRQFVEVLIAPDYDDDALAYAKKKANVRVLRIPHGDDRNNIDMKRVGSGLLMQTADIREVSADELKVVTKLAPTAEQLGDLLFAWRVAKYVKSNAIVYAKDKRTIGVGAGQMSRVYSARIAGIKANDAGLVVSGSVMASDAFFPFRDGIDAAAEAGIRAVIQPGGSMRDAEVIAAADEHGIAMVFTACGISGIDRYTRMPRILIRDATDADFDRIVELNDVVVRDTSAMDRDRLQRLHALAFQHRVALSDDRIVGFILSMRDGAAYINDNFGWFSSRYPHFVYIDRIVVDDASAGRGIGRFLYEDLFARSRAEGIGIIACEYNLEPPNPGSKAFHDRLGFKEVGIQRVANGTKRVSLQVAEQPCFAT